jgi:trehalose 6-phosphate phosphatase
LFLDIDGTLVPIAPTPADVRPSPDLPRLLTRAAADLGNALAIVSGREITSIDQVTQGVVPYAAGSHGAEFRSAWTSNLAPRSTARYRRPRPPTCSRLMG